MTQRHTPAERLDRALDELIGGRPPSTDLGPEGRGLLAAAAAVTRALPLPPVSPRFEGRVGAELAERASGRDALSWVVRHPGRLLVTGAVGSAAVGVGVTAFAFWRRGRADASPLRLLHR
jgi:hypothetical protein